MRELDRKQVRENERKREVIKEIEDERISREAVLETASWRE
jgi:hypothetical protein